MLQRTVWSQLARIECSKIRTLYRHVQFREKQITPFNFRGPQKATMDHVVHEMEQLPGEKHWLASGIRSCCVAIDMLRKNEVIAVPTDTIYGFAALAQSNNSIDRIYEIKGRNKTKPLAIALSKVRHIKEWAESDHLSSRLINDLLPGPVTIILKRKTKLNPYLNPEHDSVGIRVPQSKFIRTVCEMIGEPLALTSANLSDQQSSLIPEEFRDLWPQLGAIFYDNNHCLLRNEQRTGSTIIDLTVPRKFKIIRKGKGYARDYQVLQNYLQEDRNEIALEPEREQ